MDEPLTMERNDQTYYYHRDALGSITEVSDEAGNIVERYEYDVYGEVAIFDGSGITLTLSAIGNPYLFTGRRYDPESGNYYYRARVYSPALGRFLSMDPLGFDAGDYNLYRYAFNNPATLTDPTGEFAFIPWLLKASAEAAADALMQALFNYFFDPTVTTAEEALESIDLRRVGWAFVTGLFPGGRWVRSLAGAAGETILYILDAQERCQELAPEDILNVFVMNLGAELLGDYIGDLVVKYGTRAVAAGFRELGFDELVEKAIHYFDDLDVGLCSFSTDTLVMTLDGLNVIDALEIGDYVLAYDEETDEIGYFPVLNIWVHQDPIVVLLTISGEVVETTPEHPFYVGEGEWKSASALQIGDEVWRLGSHRGIVEAVKFVYLPQMMYNLTIADAHTYFVGEGQWLVHNQCFKQYNIVRYGKRLPSGSGFEKHHGVLNEWAEANVPNYVKNDAPAILLTKKQHNATRSWFGKWRYAKTGSIHGAVDWANMSPVEVQDMAEQMFKAAGVPDSEIRRYFQTFHRYIYTGTFK